MHASIRRLSPITRPYRFHIGASFAGKKSLFGDEAAKPKRDFSPSSPIYIWREEQLNWKKANGAKTAGEDFFFIQQMRNKSGISFGVADGVGGWGPHYDPSFFAQALMYYARTHAARSWAGEPDDINPISGETMEGTPVLETTTDNLSPKKCLALAHQDVLAEPKVEAGSSTACIINLDARTGRLEAANLGDSGFAILRSSALKYVQPAQTHYWNCPWQLAKLPRSERFEDYNADPPSSATEYGTNLRHGDIVFSYTDGFSDNVFLSKLKTLTSQALRSSTDEARQAQTLADLCVQFAQQRMVDKSKVSPFEKEARRNNLRLPGGKVDDVTIIVALVSEGI